MSAKIIDGKVVAAAIKLQLRERIKKFKKKPKLVIVWVGEDPATASYIAQKQKVGEELGIEVEISRFPETMTQGKLIEKIKELNANQSVDGFIIQTPLPKQISKKELAYDIDPQKDVDGANPTSPFPGATPAGIVELLKRSGIDVTGKHVVVVGRSDLVGKPLALLLLENDATVTICHSKTQNLPELTRLADILIVAIGKPKLIKADMVKRGAVVIDVGINRVAGKLIGDVDFEEVSKVAGHVTPVPGGVGPMTVVMLLDNLVKACLLKILTNKEKSGTK